MAFELWYGMSITIMSAPPKYALFEKLEAAKKTLKSNESEKKQNTNEISKQHQKIKALTEANSESHDVLAKRIARDADAIAKKESEITDLKNNLTKEKDENKKLRTSQEQQHV